MARRLAAGAAIGASALFAAEAQAADFPVTSTLDDGSAGTLRNAVASANSTAGDDTISFQTGLTGTITLGASGELSIDPTTAADKLEIVGPGAGTLTITGNDAARIFDVSSDSGEVTISGLTLTHGSASGGGAIFSDGGALTISAVDVNTNHSSSQGGAIETNGPLAISGSTISGNTSTAQGAGIYSESRAVITGSTLSNNIATGEGGAIASKTKYAELKLSGSTISGNHAAQGGGIYLNQLNEGYAVRNEITNTTISGNTSAGDGGGMTVGFLGSNKRIDVLRSTISGNHADSGFGGGLLFSDCSCGAIEGPVAVTDSTISGNTAASGAGVSVGDAGENRVVSDTGSIEFDNSTIASNIATSAGGGVFFDQYDSDDPVPVKKSATVAFTSTIVGDNAPQDVDRIDTSTSGGADLAFSLVEAPAADTGLLTQATTRPSIVGADPKLGALGANGGPTSTQLPAADSPAIDKGVAPPRLDLDQRGQTRTVDGTGVDNAVRGDGTDIGAVELQSPPAKPPDQPPPPPDLLPAASITSNKLAARKARKRVVRGTASDDHAVAKVEVAVVKKARGRCRSMRASGRFGRARSCAAPPAFLAAKGTGKWSFKAKRRLKRGNYFAIARATDDKGQVQTTFGTASIDPFRV